jgi:hypothetical protein
MTWQQARRPRFQLLVDSTGSGETEVWCGERACPSSPFPQRELSVTNSSHIGIHSLVMTIRLLLPTNSANGASVLIDMEVSLHDLSRVVP